MPNISLSHHAYSTLHTIYDKYLARKNNNIIHVKASYFQFDTIKCLFPNATFDEILSSLLELSKNHLIYFYSDGSISLNSYVTFYMKHNNISKTSDT